MYKEININDIGIKQEVLKEILEYINSHNNLLEDHLKKIPIIIIKRDIGVPGDKLYQLIDGYIRINDAIKKEEKTIWCNVI